MNLDDIFNLDRLSPSDPLSENTEFIPLVTSEDDIDWSLDEMKDDIPILPLRNTVIFPGVVTPITAGRDKSLRLIKEANKGNKIIGVISQKNADTENPGPDDIYEVGTVARIVRSLKMPDGNTTIIIQGKKRFRIKEWTQHEPFDKAHIELLNEDKPSDDDENFSGLIGSVKESP